MRSIAVFGFILSFLLLSLTVGSFSLKKGLTRILDMERSESSLPFSDNFTEHQFSDTNLPVDSMQLDVEAWLKWTKKVVPVVVCIGLIGHLLGGSADVLLMMSTMIVFGLMIMEILEGGKIPLDTVGKEGLNNAANKINKLGRDSVIIITGGVVISILAVVDFMRKKITVTEKP